MNAKIGFWTLMTLTLLWSGRALAAAHCSVSATAVAFGTFSSPNPVNVDSVGTVSVSCTGLGNGGAGYVIALNQGGAGSFYPRTLASGSHLLQYNLYTDSSRTLIWGDGTAGTSTVSDSLFDRGSSSANYTVYGRVPANQNIAPGTYSDVITVTVSY